MWLSGPCDSGAHVTEGPLRLKGPQGRGPTRLRAKVAEGPTWPLALAAWLRQDPEVCKLLSSDVARRLSRVPDVPRQLSGIFSNSGGTGCGTCGHAWKRWGWNFLDG